MENENKQFEPKAPDFTGDGVAVWIRQDKNGNDFLSIKTTGHNTITAFKNVPKAGTTENEQTQ